MKISAHLHKVQSSNLENPVAFQRKMGYNGSDGPIGGTQAMDIKDPQELLADMVSAIQADGPPLPNGPAFHDRLLTTSVTKIQMLRLAMKGLTATEAAKVVGVSPETARAYYRDPEFRLAVQRKVDAAFADVDAAFDRKRRNLHEILEEQAYESCQDLIDMLQNPDLHPSLRVKINQDFLNRHEDSSTIQRGFKMDPSDLRHAAKVAAEMDNVIPIKKSA